MKIHTSQADDLLETADLDKWNTYGSFFEAQGADAAPRFGDGKFQIVGRVKSLRVTAYTEALAPGLFPSGWPAGVLGYTIYRQQTSTFRILEADVLLNDEEFVWITDDAKIYDGTSGAKEESFHATMLHELAHVLGLDHDFNDLSIMGYPVKNYRGTSLPFAVDLAGLRSAYVNFADKLTTPKTDLGVYLFAMDPNGNNAWSDSSFPTSVTAGGTLTVSNVTVENLGTAAAAPQLTWYLAPVSGNRSLTGNVQLGTQTLMELQPAGQEAGNVRGSSRAVFTATLQIPQGLSGSYYLYAKLAEDGGAAVATYPYSNNHAFSRLPVQVSTAPQKPVPTVSFNSTSVTVGRKVQGTLTLQADATQDVTFALSATPNLLTFAPVTVQIKQGARSASFTATAGAVTAETPVTVTATPAGDAASTYGPGTGSVTVLAALQAAFSGTSRIPSNSSGLMRLTLSANTPEGITFKLTADAPKPGLVKFEPATVTIEAGRNEAQFTVKTGKATKLTTVNLTANGGGVEAKGTLTIEPGAVTLQIVSLGVTPIVRGQRAGVATLKLKKAPTAPVEFTVTGTAGLSIQGSTTVEAGKSSVDFEVAANDTAAGGTESITVTAVEDERLTQTASVKVVVLGAVEVTSVAAIQPHRRGLGGAVTTIKVSWTDNRSMGHAGYEISYRSVTSNDWKPLPVVNDPGKRSVNLEENPFADGLPSSGSTIEVRVRPYFGNAKERLFGPGGTGSGPVTKAAPPRDPRKP